MKDKLNELKWLPTKGDPLSQVKTHNIIIDNLSELDEDGRITYYNNKGETIYTFFNGKAPHESSKP